VSGPDKGGAFFSAPFEPEEVQRLLAVVDERLRLRQSLNLPRSAEVGLLENLPMPAPPEPDPESFVAAESLHELPAPLFTPGKGGRVARIVKVILNWPLRVFGTPQLYFNAVVRHVVRGWSSFLRSTADFQALIRIDLEAQRDGLARLAREQRQLAAALQALQGAVRRLAASAHDGLVVRLASEDSAPPIVVAAIPAPGVDVVASFDALPLAPGAVAELVAEEVLERRRYDEVERRLLPHWRTLLQPGGRLRLVCVDWLEALERYRTGRISLEQLRRFTFGPGEDHRTAYTSATLVPVLTSAGFVDCSVTSLAGDAEGAPRMEVVAHRPRT